MRGLYGFLHPYNKKHFFQDSIELHEFMMEICEYNLMTIIYLQLVGYAYCFVHPLHS